MVFDFIQKIAVQSLPLVVLSMVGGRVELTFGRGSAYVTTYLCSGGRGCGIVGLGG